MTAMRWLGSSMGRAALALACVYLISCAGYGDEEPGAAPATAPAGAAAGGDLRPASVPADYVATANGYLHPSCIVELAAGDVVQDQGPAGVEIRSAGGSSRTVGACAFPRYRANGEVISRPGLAGAPTPGAGAPAVQTTTSALLGTFGQDPDNAGQPVFELLSLFTVPSTLPAYPVEVSLWAGVEDASPSTYVMQPVLDSLAGGAWGIHPCYDSPSGVFTCQPVVTVNPGDLIQAWVQGTTCTSSACSSFFVRVWDLTTDQNALDLTVTLASGQATPARVIGAAMEIFGVSSCNQLPGGPLPRFVSQWEDVWGGGHATSWHVQDMLLTPDCDYASWSAPHGVTNDLYVGWYTGADPIAYSFDAVDNRGYSGLADWAPQQTKAECETTGTMVGLSSDPATSRAHSALCAYNGSINSKELNPSWSVAVDFSAHDGRRDTTTGDWDPHYYKGECAANEAVTGVAQDLNGKLTKVLCTRPYQEQFFAGSCYTRVFSGGDNRGDNSGSPDWAPWYYKGQCQDNGVTATVKGVSRNPSTGQAHAILCCRTLPSPS
jgi:hypothetical protein